MERLTSRFKDEGYITLVKCGDCLNSRIDDCSCNELHLNAALDKLAAYEDAEEQGRLMILHGDLGKITYNLKEDELESITVEFDPDTSEPYEIAVYKRYGVTSDKARLWGKADKQGRLVVLPCKIGDVVYFNTWDDSINKYAGIKPHVVTSLYTRVCVENHRIPTGQFGKNVFLTRAEAEAALSNG